MGPFINCVKMYIFGPFSHESSYNKTIASAIKSYFKWCHQISGKQTKNVGYRVFNNNLPDIKSIYSQKTTKFCKNFTVDLPHVVSVKSTVEISQNCVAFSEYTNFTTKLICFGFIWSIDMKCILAVTVS